MNKICRDGTGVKRKSIVKEIGYEGMNALWAILT